MASDPDVAGFVGGLLLAVGILMVLLGGLCTGWIVVPATVMLWSRQGLRTIGELWPVLAGGGATMAIGVLTMRAGLRRLRG